MPDIQSLNDLIHRALVTSIVISMVLNAVLACIVVRKRQRAAGPLSVLRLFADRTIFILATVNVLIYLVVLGLSHHQIIQSLLFLTAGFFTAINVALALLVTFEKR